MTAFRIRRTLLVLFPLFIAALFLIQWPEERHEAEVIISVKPQGIDKGLVFRTIDPLRFEVKISGPRSVIESISSQSLSYPLNLTGLGPGVHTLPVNRNRISLPEHAGVEALSPTVLTVHLEKEVLKELPVIPEFFGKPAAGFIIAEAEIKPKRVKIRGPAILLKPLETVRTKPLDISHLSESVKKETALDLPQGVEAITADVFTAEIVISEKIVTQRFEHIPVVGKGTANPYSINPKTISVEVKGPANDLKILLTQKKVEIFVDLSGLAPGIYVRRATITLPVNTRLMGADPEVFTVTIGAPS